MQGRRFKLLLVVAAFAAIAGTAAPAAAKKAKPSPTPVPQPNVVPGYYVMLGNQIVSTRYADLPSCLKDLNDAKHRMLPGSDQMACAHRFQ